jgi:hypothetical protein
MPRPRFRHATAVTREPKHGAIMDQTSATDIDISELRISPACLQRWQRRSSGRVRQLADGSILGPERAHIFDDGRLSVSCAMTPTWEVYLSAAPYEWWECVTIPQLA